MANTRPCLSTKTSGIRPPACGNLSPLALDLAAASGTEQGDAKNRWQAARGERESQLGLATASTLKINAPAAGKHNHDPELGVRSWCLSGACLDQKLSAAD